MVRDRCLESLNALVQDSSRLHIDKTNFGRYPCSGLVFNAQIRRARENSDTTSESYYLIRTS